MTDQESSRFLLFDSVATLLKNLARTRALLLVVDDLQDADQPSLQMLRFIARGAKDVPLLILGTYRDSEVKRSPELGKLVGELLREGRSLSLTGLSKAEVGDFISARMGGTADERLVADLYRATDGNALYVEGVVRLLESKEMHEPAADENDRFKIPDGVRESIRRQLARLSSEANYLLSVASVIGNEFENHLLERVAERSREQVVQQTEEAVRIGLLRSHPPESASQQFAHALVRDALYEELGANRRVKLHGEIGAALEAVHQRSRNDHLAALAYHFRKAGNVEKAIMYSIESGEAARKVFAYEDAAHEWRAALQLMEDHGYAPDQKARLLVALGDLEYIINIHDAKGVEFLERALQIFQTLGRPDEIAKVHSRLGALLSFRSSITDIPSAIEHYRKAEAILRDGPHQGSLGVVYAGLGMAALHLNRTAEGLAWSRRAMEVADKVGNEELKVNAATLYGTHLFTEGKLSEAISLVDRTYERADQLNVPNAYSAAWIAGFFRFFLLDPCEARGALLRELAKPRVRQAPPRRGILLDSLARAYIEAGDLVAARDSMPPDALVSESELAFYEGNWEQVEHGERHRLDEARRKGSLDDAEDRLHSLGVVQRVRGKLAAAEASLVESLSLSCVEADTRKPWQLKHRTELALIYAETNRTENAHSQLARCREILGNVEDWRGLTGLVARAEAMVAAAEAKFKDSETLFQKATEIFCRYHVPFEEAEALHYWGLALKASGELLRANEKLDAAIDIYRRCGAGERWIERTEAVRASAPKLQALPRESTRESTLAQEEAAFRREGDYWTVTYEGTTWRLKDAKGFRYIAYLLAHPGEEIRALDLMSRVGGAGVEVVDGASAEDFARSGALAGDLGHAGEMLDEQAKAEYQRRLQELEDELEEAREFRNEELIAKAEEEKEAIAHELRRAIGLAGRDRKAASSTERARVAVTRAIRLALERISKQDRNLGKLLSNTIRTGTVCSYVPDERFPVSWRL